MRGMGEGTEKFRGLCGDGRLRVAGLTSVGGARAKDVRLLVASLIYNDHVFLSRLGDCCACILQGTHFDSVLFALLILERLSMRRSRERQQFSDDTSPLLTIVCHQTDWWVSC
mmetsp:Transcript_50511/g.152159  ORF Transcript_50511/g.152159 Transcript_50511/m.152159 type:complete len:113 (+) Transcript_50511:1793-2131(+)